MQIVPYEKNAKKHPPEQIRLIATSIRDFGWQQPIKVGEGGVIIAGHGRYQAYTEFREEFKLPEPWVIDETGVTVSGSPEARKLTVHEEREYRLRDNKIAESEWDKELLVPELKELVEEGAILLNMGFSEDDLILDPDSLGDGFSLADGDKAPFQNMTFTFADAQAELIKEAMGMVDEENVETYGNKNSNGNKLYAIVQQWVESRNE